MTDSALQDLSVASESSNSVNHANSCAIWTVRDGVREVTVPWFEYDTLDHEAQVQRFLILQSSQADKNAVNNHVQCELRTEELFNAEAFIAVTNARGYRLLQDLIEVNGTATFIPQALERFLRNFRRDSEPVRLWIRHICVNQQDEQERARYWTRDFSDTMYALATETVDMSEFNNELLDQGVVEPVHESIHMSWSKKWNEAPDKTVLPRIFPIKLGQRLSNEDPQDDFQYVPLDAIVDEIRVVVLLPSLDPMGPIVCHLGHCPAHCEVTFIGLSYMWGTDTTTTEIILNGQKKRIRKTLETALRDIRSPDDAVPLWIDAICINQDDVIERGRQLPRMSRIYDNAVSVVSYAGSATPDTDLAFQCIEELQPPMMRYNHKGEWHFGKWEPVEGGIKYGENKFNATECARMTAALYKFLTRSYFRRAWILQELALASNPVIAVGSSHRKTFERLDHAAYNLVDMLRSDPRLADQMRAADPSLQEVNPRAVAYMRKLLYFRHVACSGIPLAFGFHVSKIGENAAAFLETLVLARDFEATDARDKIFALWNLAQDHDGLDFKMDYAHSVTEVYSKFTQAWIRQHHSLDILGCVEMPWNTTSVCDSLPSWCTDWSQSSKCSCLVRRERIPTSFMSVVDSQEGPLYSADGVGTEELSHDLQPKFDEPTLLCTGMGVDQIEQIFGEPPRSSPMSGPIPSPVSHSLVQRWVSRLRIVLALTKHKIYDDPVQAAVAMLHGDSPSAWPPRHENAANIDEHYQEEQYVCNPEASRHVRPYGGSYNRTDAWDTVSAVLRGRVPFISQQGYMGLAPAYVDMDSGPWHLAILAGCSVPVLLRQRIDGSYELCGTCFVQGWMDGEMVHDIMEVDSAQGFWEAVKDVAQLRIS